MKNKKIIIMIIIFIIVLFIFFCIYFNTGIKRFEKEISNYTLPNNI